MNKFNDSSFRYLMILLIIIILSFSFFIPDIFWSLNNFQSIASQIPILGVLTLAMAITMLTGGINLSIIATMNSCSLVMAFYLIHYPTSVFIAILLGLITAIIIGLVNGLLIAIVRVSPILATLGTMTLLNGLNVLLSKGSAVSNFSDHILILNSGVWFSIPIPLIIFLFLSIMLWIIFDKTTLGKSIYFIGNNERATYFSGINTQKVIVLVYIISSILCVAAALLMMSKLNSAKASYGDSYLLTAILAAVLGGVNPDGGKGKLIGILAALILLQTLESGLNIIGLSSYITMALWGALLIVFIFLQKYQFNFFTKRK
ncbi:ABC transporter permease [Testudinibacter sp. TR-2022]|uniref:ABC transporter permease n=1 Tax=Testudinibacter sp. TR-2022 TaxID=2585029 RepID=UPI001118AC24|nr:ABC transporter permease [Testudinibacter sp. TR-2022]TNH06894.1 ABC transporter permease [Pasteurellaceae bacterium Phil11]TNH21694.1 ABC transporter permease [Testudinibacter sp. TR-2022]TNH28866.1 ABC transporter permease [Testudinibacter sp. TR-2022]